MSLFDEAFAFVQKWEGGGKLHKVKGDPGGLTKYGISQRAYPDLDIAALTLDQARAIYLKDYWRRISADQVPPWLSIAVFDSAVNQGPSRALRWMQKAAGTTADGIVGPHTLKMAWETPPRRALTSFMARRALAYAAGLLLFRLGWMRRLIDCTIQAAKQLP